MTAFSLVADGYLASSAELSPCGRYRYTLARTWGKGARRALVVGFNPSIANEHLDDQTIRRLKQLLRDEGFNGFTIVNLFAWRSTDPRALVMVNDPIGPANGEKIDEALRDVHAVVLAWGGISLRGLADHQRDLLLAVVRKTSLPILCFGFTKDGAPRHPSRLPRTARLEAFR